MDNIFTKNGRHVNKEGVLIYQKDKYTCNVLHIKIFIFYVQNMKKNVNIEEKPIFSFRAKRNNIWIIHSVFYNSTSCFQ